MKCIYCKKNIWFWQKSQSFDVYDNPRHYHHDCLYHKISNILLNFGRLMKRDKQIEPAFILLSEMLSNI